MFIPKFWRSKISILCLSLTALMLSAPGFAVDSQSNSQSNSKSIKVGIELNFYPFDFMDEKNQASGFSVELIEAVAETMGLKLEFVPGTWDDVWNKLAAGEIDVVPILAKLESRRQYIDFGLPHTETFDAFFVRKKDPGYTDISSAEGKSLIVMKSDAAHHFLIDRKFHGSLIFVDSVDDGLRRL